MRWFGPFEPRAEEMSVTELVTPSVLESAAVRKAASFSERGLLPPDLNNREHGDGTQPDLSRHQHQECGQTHQQSSGNRSPHIDPIHAPAAGEPTRGEHYRRFDDDGGRLTQARGEQKDANGAENKAD
jgi:hypothetical protein